MATAKKPPVKDNTWWWSDLASMAPEMKNELWMAQMLFFMKNNSSPLLATKRWVEYNKIQRLELDEGEYKAMVDPVTPMGGGGTAEFFAADWKANPIDTHIDNIARAKMDKISQSNQLQVSEIDKYAKTQKQKDTEKIIYQREFRNLINSVNEEIGLPKIKDSESPYSYAKSLGDTKGQNGATSVDTLLDYVRSQIADSESLTLYHQYVYKGDIEKAFELGMQHYLITMNKWRIKSEYFNNDLLKFNLFSGRWYTDETTGRGTVEYLQPNKLFTSEFFERNGEDVIHWFYEKNITFSEFVRQFGTKLDEDQLKEVFELNKANGGSHGMEWKSARSAKGSNARIQIGFMSVLTQDAEKFSEKIGSSTIPSWTPRPLTWLPDKFTPNKYKEDSVTKMYNVWYSAYYVPPPGDRLSKNTAADWAWQSRYIFNIHKDIDMYRYGPDLRYAKSTLVIWKDPRPSFYDIKQAYMPKIHTAWHQFQNALIQNMSGVAFDEDLLMAGLLNAADEGNKINPGEPDDQPTGGNGKDAALQMWRSLKQGGMGWLKFRDKNGNVIADPNKLIVPFDNKMLEKAENYLKIILDLYNLMTMSLAQSDIGEGQDAKPRTPVAGIQASLAASSDANWFIEKPARECMIMFGERCIQHILCMLRDKKKYGNGKRWQEFSDVIGQANAWLLESIEDLKPEEIGLTVELEDTNAYQNYVIELANKMADDGEVGRDVVSLVMNQARVNYKYAYMLLMIGAKKKEKEKADQEELAHERQMEMLDKQLQIANAQTAAKGQAKDQNIQVQGKVDERLMQLENQLKALTLAGQKEQLLQNKLKQDQNKTELKMQEETHDAVAP